MQTKTKKVVGEICLLFLLTIVICRPTLLLCWKLIDYYEINYSNILILACFLFVLAIGIIIRCPLVKNIYIKIALAYPWILVSLCMMGILVLIGQWPA